MGLGKYFKGVVEAFKRMKEPKTHEVTVNFVQAPNVAPYFVAICECGWLGDIHDLEQPAFADAYKHHPNVVPEVQRPLEQ